MSHDRALKLLEEYIRDSVKVESIQASLWADIDTLLPKIENGGDWADYPLGNPALLGFIGAAG